MTLSQQGFAHPATASRAPRASRMRWRSLALCIAALGMNSMASAAEVRLQPVPLGTAGYFAILSKAGITTTGNTAIWGGIGVSPIASTAITGFGLMDSSGQYSLSSQVLGAAFAANYASPTPSKLITSVSNMQTAYANAAGRLYPNFINLGGGNIGGRGVDAGPLQMEHRRTNTRQRHAFGQQRCGLDFPDCRQSEHLHWQEDALSRRCPAEEYLLAGSRTDSLRDELHHVGKHAEQDCHRHENRRKIVWSGARADCGYSRRQCDYPPLTSQGERRVHPSAP